MSEEHSTEEDEPTIRVMALHAIAYCERLFFMEEVEEIRVADEAIWSGRALHEGLGEDEEMTTLTLESESLGIRGRVDAIRTRNGESYPIEHKRGRAMRDHEKQPHPWESDYIQAAAYAMLLSEHLERPVTQARVRYHQDNVTVVIPIGPAEHAAVKNAIRRARLLRQRIDRPPITEHEGRCLRCSLAPVCLPEEVRLATVLESEDDTSQPTPVRLFPPDTERRSLHVVTQGAKVSKSKGKLRVNYGRSNLAEVGIREVSDVTIHGYGQISTQALRTCANEDIPVHWVTSGGAYAGSFFGPSISVQRRIRQYQALTDTNICSHLAQRVAIAKINHQLQHLLRSSRSKPSTRDVLSSQLAGIRRALGQARRTTALDTLRGAEGIAARFYFGALPSLVHEDAAQLRPAGRSRRPPRDRFNALLSFCYVMLYRDVLSAIVRVGLEPAFGFLHQPRSAAPPLALDLMELFRVPVVDMTILGAINRLQFDEALDFRVTSNKVWLSETGRKKAIDLYERRKHDEYKHPVLDYSLSYAHMMELEVRLLEKEWSGEAGLFAQFRFR